MHHGDFSNLADNYSKYRPGYSEVILTELFDLINKPPQEIDFADVGAGTGIWTRMVANRGCKSVIAVEPNDNMRANGERDSGGADILWKKGTGEDTNLSDNSVDFLTMASSFHWVNYDKATNEFARVLRNGGRFAALWNPRSIEDNQVLVEIENKLHELVPGMKRVSSGRSGLTDVLLDKLKATTFFKDVIYIEEKETVKQTPEHYLGVWWSVNDIRVQAGEKIFKEFMEYVENKIMGMDYIETTYLTRVWSAVVTK